jgi:hypothetical protein
MVRPHHLVVLVLDDVAMPHIEAGDIELRLNTSDFPRIHCNSILEPGLP